MVLLSLLNEKLPKRIIKSGGFVMYLMKDSTNVGGVVLDDDG